MTENNEPNSSDYVVTLVRKGRVMTQNFARLVEAIRFLKAEFDTGDGYTERGEIHREGLLVWRRFAARRAALMRSIDHPKIQNSE